MGEVLDALNAAGGVSCYHYVTTVSFRDVRAKNEALQLGQFIDAYLAMDVKGEPLPESSELLDLMCRRLTGVLKADEYGNWSLATATQKAGASRLMGNELFTALAKAANAHDRVHKNVSRQTAAAGAGGGYADKARRRGRRGQRSEYRGGAGASSSAVSGAQGGTAARSAVPRK